ncbi:MAG: M43 family zinc metalloprotease [Chitinophagaceae bacterium]
MNKLLLLAIFLLLLTAKSFSQPICGFDSMHARSLKNPSYRKKVDDINASIRSYINKNRLQLESRVSSVNATLYYIPVVVHVIHTGGAIGSIYNPTDAQITDAIAYLNEVYNGTYPGTAGVGDLQLQFVLAKRDPNCNPTNGINRVNGSSLANYAANGIGSGGAAEVSVKALSKWSNTSYYNIWVVNKIDGMDGTSGQFVAGYAYYPGNPASVDGTVMLATQMKRGAKTLPHEIGHAFNLYHPFEGSVDKNTCPDNSDCNTKGDQVCDTDPITYNIDPATGIIDFSPRTGINPCSGTNYSDNTERNYMNYTSIYTVFTQGQKNRLLASAGTSRASLTTSLGGTATTDPTNPCTPKIDFEFTEDQPTETTSATIGCKNYKDYTYNMVIGNSPSAAATVTLNITPGTAVEGLDYDITTNGNFASPSKILTFPANSTAAQSFTVRIYDDAEVESLETFTLGFNVNSGAGNAVKGDSRISLTITIADNDVAPVGAFNVTKALGTYTNTLVNSFGGANAKQKSELLYRASELTAAGIKPGNITGLSLNIIKHTAVSFVYQGLTIRMGNSIVNTFGPINNLSGYTTVYSNNYSTVNGLNTFTFSTPFVWDGVSNIVIVICYDNGSTTESRK